MRRQHTKNTFLQIPQAIATNPKLQRRIFSSTQEKLKNKKSPTLQKNRTSQPHKPRQTSTLTGCDLTYTDSHLTRKAEGYSGNMGSPKAG